MAKIHILDKAVAELIAAGEVVERPASIVKELVENSIDAGASAVTVEIEGGGITMIRITDNGCGIARAEIPTAFLSHATSKVREARDLDEIGTLGFRGEALASIAAVSRVELTTKTAAETEGSVCTIQGGEAPEVSDAGCPDGTVICVRDVFYNTPARMKFLKKDVSEANAVAQTVDRCALSHPEIAFRFVRDGKVRLQTSGGGDLLAVIRAIYGPELAERMIPVHHDMPEDGLSVSGFVSVPAAARASRAYQNFFLNGRFIRNRTASSALEEAYRTLLGSGRFPACALDIRIAPSLVDVNVHPSKTEVRFAQERPVFHCVYFAVRSGLSGGVAALNPVVRRTPSDFPGNAAGDRGRGNPLGASSGAGGAARHSMRAGSTPQIPQRMSAREYQAMFSTPGEDGQDPYTKFMSRPASERSSNAVPRPENPVRTRENNAGAADSDRIFPREHGTILPEHATNEQQNDTVIRMERGFAVEGQTMLEESAPRLVGELYGTYILLEREDGLILVDKHAAHERILYERLRRSVSAGDRQVLLSPISVTPAREEYDALIGNLGRVEELGFLVEDFGAGSLLVREVPIELSDEDVAFILGEIAEKLCRGSRDPMPDTLDRLYYSIACKSALRARDKSSHPELEEILRLLSEEPDITHCPHGRPVRVELSLSEIEKMFSRQG